MPIIELTVAEEITEVECPFLEEINGLHAEIAELHEDIKTLRCSACKMVQRYTSDVAEMKSLLRSLVTLQPVDFTTKEVVRAEAQRAVAYSQSPR